VRGTTQRGGVTRVLCDASFPLELVRDLLPVEVQRAGPPWAADGVVGLLSFEPVTADDLARLPELRVIATPSVGVDHLDVESATERGVWVCNVPDYCIEEMADHALALLLALIRGVVELDRSVRGGRWDYAAAGPLRRTSEMRLGVIGFGRIGRALAARARALGMDVTAHDPLVSNDEIRAGGARPETLEALLASSDAISVHAPLTPETRGLIGAEQLSQLPKGAFVVNAARAGLVDTAALLRALDDGRLAGAALDVLDVEPPTADAPAPSAPRLIVNPHAGWYSEEAHDAAVRRAIESVLDVLEGRRPRGAVNEVASPRR
jgi:D-3-phosphoglycerate dehydrogenase / 2-oxoglutarate reductase